MGSNRAAQHAVKGLGLVCIDIGRGTHHRLDSQELLNMRLCVQCTCMLLSTLMKELQKNAPEKVHSPKADDISRCNFQPESCFRLNSLS